MSEDRKKPGPKPTTGKGHTVGVRLHDDLLTPLDAFIADRPDIKSRPEAIRMILQGSLIGLRYIEMPKNSDD